jgi:hypothetical protein
METKEIQDLIAALALDTQAFKAQLIASQEYADRRAAETDQRNAEAKAEADRTMEDLKRQIKELGKQIGGLGNKFGSFTEGISLPSVRQLLFDRFGVEDFMPGRRRRTGADTIELDALGVVGGERNEGYIVEIKSHLRSDALEQMRSTLARFRGIFTEYAHLKLYGIIVAADANKEVLEEARQSGFYVITFEEDLMRFHDDNGFVPKAY